MEVKGSFISVRDVSHTYDGTRDVLRSVSFEMGPGITALLGLNGAGKSTLLSILAGRMRPTQGKVKVVGRDPVDYAMDVRSVLGVVPEVPPVVPQLTPEEHFRLLERIHGPQEVEWLMDALELHSHFRVMAGHLSKGFRQRLSIALALYHRPRVLLLDEPTSGLDPAQQDALLELLSSLAPQTAILFSTHHIPEAERVASRVLVLAEGRLVYDGPPSDGLKDAVLGMGGGGLHEEEKGGGDGED